MSDLSLLAEFEQYEVSEKYKKEKDAKFFKWIKILVIALVAVLLAELFLLKVVHPSMGEPKIVFSGNSNYSTDLTNLEERGIVRADSASLFLPEKL